MYSNNSAKTIVVTGASRGIGRAIAENLARDGFRVVLVARNLVELEAATGNLQNKQLGHLSVGADLTNPVDRERAIGLLPEDIFGVVHNLGGSLGVADFWAPSESYSSVWNLNLGVAHELNRHFIPRMAELGGGRVVFISTLATQLCVGNPAYVVAKAGLEMYAKMLVAQLRGTGVVASVVRPGAIRVPGRYLARLEESDPESFQRWVSENNSGVGLGEPRDVAVAVSFLLSEATRYLAGAVLDVNGGAN